MAQEVAPGQTRIDAAKDVLNDVIDAIPEQEGVNVGFRVYGHEGSNQEADRAESCQSSDLIVPIDGVDKDALRDAVASYEPVGWTPITLSLERAAADFSAAEKRDRARHRRSKPAAAIPWRPRLWPTAVDVTTRHRLCLTADEQHHAMRR